MSPGKKGKEQENRNTHRHHNVLGTVQELQPKGTGKILSKTQLKDPGNNWNDRLLKALFSPPLRYLIAEYS